MQDDTSVILLASNLSQTAPRTSRFKEFAAKFSTIIENSDFNGILRLVQAYSNSEILEDLRRHSARMTVLHFEGRTENYQALLEAARASPIGDLPTYLGGLKKLRFVFLSGCATEDFINALLDSGVPAVITSSHRLTLKEIELFSDTVYEQLLHNATLQVAFQAAKKSLSIEEGQNQRIFVNLRGLPNARKWIIPKSRVIGNTHEQTSDNLESTHEDRMDKQPNLVNPSGIDLGSLEITIPLPELLSVAELADRAGKVIQSIDSIYSVLTIFSDIDQVTVDAFTDTDWDEIPTKDKTAFLHGILNRSGKEPLRVRKIHYGSPFIFDALGELWKLGFIQEIIAFLKKQDIISLTKDLTYSWRKPGKTEQKLADLEVTSKEIEVKKEQVELDTIVAQATNNHEKMLIEQIREKLSLLNEAKQLGLKKSALNNISKAVERDIKYLAESSVSTALKANISTTNPSSSQ